MKNNHIVSLSTILLLFFVISNADAYTAPRRMIEVRPSASAISAKNLYGTEIEDGIGYGGGLKIRAQLFGGFGYLLSGSAYTLDVNEKDEENKDVIKSKTVSLFVGGLYFTYQTRYGLLRFDLGYGAISTGKKAETLFLPTVEFSRGLTDRLSLVAEFGLPVANDWAINSEFEENYTTYTLSGGIAYIF